MVDLETVPGVVGQVQSGQLRALALSSDKRRSLLPDVPTVSEGGIAGYEVTSWNGFVVPARTPEGVVMRLNAEIAKALAQPDMAKRFTELGLVTKPSSPQEMQAIYDALDRHHGNKPDAAEELGISLKTLYNKLNQTVLQEKAA